MVLSGGLLRDICCRNNETPLHQGFSQNGKVCTIVSQRPLTLSQNCKAQQTMAGYDLYFIATGVSKRNHINIAEKVLIVEFAENRHRNVQPFTFSIYVSNALHTLKCVPIHSALELHSCKSVQRPINVCRIEAVCAFFRKK